MRTWLAATAVWTMVPVAKRSDPVARSPSAVNDTVGFIVIKPDTRAVDVSVPAADYDAA